MTLVVNGIRWDVLAEYIKKNGPEKPMEDHKGLQVNGEEVILREGICVDLTIKSYPLFSGHLLISSGKNPSGVSILVLDPVEKKGTILIGGSFTSIEKDGSITEVQIDPEKSRNVGLSLNDQATRNLAEAHKDIYLKVLRQMNIV